MAKARAEDFATLLGELTSLVDRLRDELRGCLQSVLPVLDGARACGRALGLKRQLGWRAYTVAMSTELPTVLEALPRRAGWSLIRESLRKARCPERKLQSLDEAIEAVLAPLESGRINRTMLRSLAQGRLDNSREVATLLRARRSAREGAEQIYGVRCGTQVGTYFIGPAGEDGWIDIVTLMEYDGLRRLRPGPAVGIKFATQMWHTAWEGSRLSRPLRSKLEQYGFIPELSTPKAWEERLQVKPGTDRVVICLDGETKSVASPTRLVFADFVQRGGTVGQADDRVDLLLSVNLPTERCVFEVWMHRSLARITDPVASLLGAPSPMGSYADQLGAVPLPLEAEVTQVSDAALTGDLRALSATHAQAVDLAAAALGGKPSDFIGFRVVVPDPPSGSRLHLRWRM